MFSAKDKTILALAVRENVLETLKLGLISGYVQMAQIQPNELF